MADFDIIMFNLPLTLPGTHFCVLNYIRMIAFSYLSLSILFATLLLWK